MPAFAQSVPVLFPRLWRAVPSRPLCQMTVESSTGVRINKCFSSFASRREADLFVQQGRVTVNGRVVSAGTRVKAGDTVSLDDVEIDWERLTLASTTSAFKYIKHWKDAGVICTTDADIPGNIISQVNIGCEGGVADRIFPVGRLDENSTGIILLTSDGRLPNAMLGAARDCTKEYIVTPDIRVSDEHIEKLREGVEISTVAQRDHKRKDALVAATLPCEVERVGDMKLRICIKEGRNRQIRKMLGALGYTTRAIHRVSFAGISLDGLAEPGSWAFLTDEEMKTLKF